MRRPPVIAMNPQAPDPGILERAAGILRTSGLVILPTDTTYILAANALAPEALAKVFGLKKRPPDKPLHVAVADLDMASPYVRIDALAKALAQAFLPGPLTLILPLAGPVPDLLVAGRGTLGIRIPENRICLALAKKARVPITATSANLSGAASTYDVDTILQQMGGTIQMVDLILDQGPLSGLPPSTLVDLTAHPLRILRQGPISEVRIAAVANAG